MPLPLIVAGAGVIAVIGLLRRLLREKHKVAIAILGANATGKTTLATFLSTDTVPGKQHEATITSDTLGGRLVQLEDVKLDIDTIEDVPGSSHRYASWKKAINDSNIILYIFRVDQVMKNNEQDKSRIKKDIGQIRNFIKNKEKNEESELYFVIIGTHSDLVDSDLNKLKLTNRKKFSNKIAKLEEQIYDNDFFKKVFILGGGKGKIIHFCGSLKSKGSTEATVHRLIKEINQFDG